MKNKSKIFRKSWFFDNFFILKRMDNKLKLMVVSANHLPPRFRHCTFCYSESELRDYLNVMGSKCADDYGHTVICNYFLIERKTGDIGKAIIQLETTLKLLLQMNLKIAEVIIICKGFNNTNKKLYKTRTLPVNGTKKKILFDKNYDKAICCNNDKKYPIEVVYL